MANENQLPEDDVTEARKWNITKAIEQVLEFQKIAIEQGRDDLLAQIPQKVELIAETYSKPR